MSKRVLKEFLGDYLDLLAHGVIRGKGGHPDQLSARRGDSWGYGFISQTRGIICRGGSSQTNAPPCHILILVYAPSLPHIENGSVPRARKAMFYKVSEGLDPHSLCGRGGASFAGEGISQTNAPPLPHIVL